MSSIFRFKAVKTSTGEAVKVDVWLAGINRGFTPAVKDQYLGPITLNSSGP